MAAVRFILDGVLREIEPSDPTETVLQWLRGSGRCGTKEGCAEGDCGACTVVLGELDEAGASLRLRPVNGCLVFLPVLDGKALFTVESLRHLRPGGPDGLHPAQEALVECHGSQCGFCTPGFVLSIFALLENDLAAAEAGGARPAPPSRARIDEVLAGNLCRCTGYRPIVDAVERAYALARERAPWPRDALVAQLRALRRAEALVVEAGGRRFLAPRSLAEAAELLARWPDAHLLAGGTDLGLLVTKAHRRLDTVLYLGAVPELTAVRDEGDALVVGAALPYSDLLPHLRAHHPELGALLRRIGSQQIRNLGTLGGNLGTASPIGDTLPALLALDASVVLARRAEGGGCATRELPVEAFVTGYRRTALAPGELVAAVRLPRPRPGQRFLAYKVSKRFDADIAAVCGAFALELEGDRVRSVRLAFGGMAATPRRARAAEAALAGRSFDAEAVEAAVAALDRELSPLSDFRASARYRRLVAGNLLRKLHAEVAGSSGASRLALEEA